MNPRINKRMTSLAIILMLSMTASMMLVLPSANAHTPSWEIPTYAYINVAPNPVGVNQQTVVIFWLTNVYDNALLSNDYRFHNYELTITAPDGHTTTQNFPTATDPTSSQYTLFTPTQVGTYTLDFSFPGQVVNDYSHDPNSAYINDTYLPSSATTTLTVQEEPLPAPITSYPLPSSYWTRPIYGENTDWWSISSNWLGTGAPGYSGFGFNSRQQSFPGDAVGPLTSHVMWTKPLQSGGVVGGDNFLTRGDTYFDGSAYQQRYTNPIVVNGKIYYKEPVSFSGPSSGPLDCVDLRTGELIWSKNLPSMSFAYIYDVQDPNQHGVYPAILFSGGGGFFGGSSTLQAFDADTGVAMFNVTNVPSGQKVLGYQGEQIIYVLTNKGNFTNPDYYLSSWNSSKMWEGQYNGPSTSPSIIPPYTDGSNPIMYDWNISIPEINTMASPISEDYAFLGNMVICHSGAMPAGASLFSQASWTPYTYFAINLNETRGPLGEILWTNTVQPAPNNVTVSIGPADPVAGVFTEGWQQTMQWVGYSMQTGEKIWGPTDGQTPFDYYGTPAFPYVQGCAAYGNMYSSGLGGILYCYNISTGDLEWTYGNDGAGNSTRSGFQNAYGDYPTFINAIGNGVVYLVTTEHTINTPLYKGAMNRAVNATTGEEIWTISGYTGEFGTTSFAIADGFATWFNSYDNQIYVVGRGPSKTTVDAPLTVVPQGSSVMIQGTVTDISAGTTQDEQAADFPNGVPAVSDDSMTAWMGYVYQQKPHPDATGVPVHLTAIDPNGNYQDIGTVTTDISGLYHIMYTPPVPGEYTVTASFDGTNAYWPSYATTSIGVSEAPAASVVPTSTPSQASVPTASPVSSPTSSPTTPSPTTTSTPAPVVTESPTTAPAPTAQTPMTLYVAIAAVVVIIAIVAAAIVLRKRK
jgi:outer membrane protein assembly factor BamB